MAYIQTIDKMQSGWIREETMKLTNVYEAYFMIPIRQLAKW